MDNHGAVSTAMDSYTMDNTARASKAVREALASDIQIRKHGLHMLILCAECDRFIVDRLLGNKIYQLLAGLDSDENAIYCTTLQQSVNALTNAGRFQRLRSNQPFQMWSWFH